MAGEATDRRFWTVVFLASVDFCCILLATERYDKGNIKIGTAWLIAGVFFSLIGWKWPQLRAKFGQAKNALPEFRPRVVPVKYAKAEESQWQWGMHLRNPGYDALDVRIPGVSIGTSGYTLVFPSRLAQFGERSGIEFLAGWLEHSSRNGTTGKLGSELHGVMRDADIETVNFSILYKDTDSPAHEYQTNCYLKRAYDGPEAIEVGTISQELLTDVNQK